MVERDCRPWLVAYLECDQDGRALGNAVRPPPEDVSHLDWLNMDQTEAGDDRGDLKVAGTTRQGGIGLDEVKVGVATPGMLQHAGAGVTTDRIEPAAN